MIPLSAGSCDALTAHLNPILIAIRSVAANSVFEHCFTNDETIEAVEIDKRSTLIVTVAKPVKLCLTTYINRSFSIVMTSSID